MENELEKARSAIVEQARQLVIAQAEREKAEQALRECEERYRPFIDEALTGNFIVQPDGAITTCNPAFLRIFGFGSAEEALSTNFMSLEKLLEIELMQKRTKWKQAKARQGTLRTLSFLFLLLVIVGALAGFYYFFSSGALSNQKTHSAPGSAETPR